MAQHFLLSAAARTLSLRTIYASKEEDAHEAFCKLRWAATSGEPVCPRCGSLKVYRLTRGRRFKCGEKGCLHYFSVTSGTIFHGRKMSFQDLLAAVCIFVNAVTGVSSLQLSRDLNCQYKTAFVLAHKLREALAPELEPGMLGGEVDIDGCYFGTTKKVNRAPRFDRRRAKKPHRRVVVALRERGGEVVAVVTKQERQGIAAAKLLVDRDSIIYVDEAPHWADLRYLGLDYGWTVREINHQEAYSFGNGWHTNYVESFFSRLRLMIRGKHRRVSPKYLYQYANEGAWKENQRRRTNGEQFDRLLILGLGSPISPQWSSYWQRRHRDEAEVFYNV